MTSSWLLLRASLRRRWLGTALLVALVGVAGGICLAAWAGARRTESAYPRMREATNAEDVTVFYDTPPTPADLELLGAAPGVQRVGPGVGFAAAPVDETGIPQLEPGIALVGGTDGRIGYEWGGLLVIEGRVPDLDATDEVMVNTVLRDQGHPVGSTIDLCVFSFEEVGQAGLPEEPTEEQLRSAAQELCAFVEAQVVGVGRDPGEFATTALTADELTAFAGPAFAADPPKPPSFSFAIVDLASPDDLGPFTEALSTSEGSHTGVTSSDIKITTVERATDPYVRTLTIFALVAAVASLGVLGPALVRWAAPSSDELHAVRALGVTRRQTRALAVARTLLVSASAGIVAAVVAIAASPIFPVGPTAKAEPDPGIRVDGLVLGIGLLAMLCLGAVLGALVRTTDRPEVTRPSTLVRRVGALGAAPATVIGVRNAVRRAPAEGAGPVTAGAGVFAAILAVTAALTFGAGLDRLIDDPDRYGWTWDALYEGYDEGLDPAVLDILDRDPRVEGLSFGYRPDVQVAGLPVPTFAFQPQRGQVGPSILEGRAPRDDTEVALGGQTLDRLNLEIGDRVALTGTEGDELEATIVGRTLLPVINLGEDVSVGEGALIDLTAAENFGAVDPDYELIDLAPGISAEDLEAELVASGLLPEENQAFVGPQLTGDLLSYSRVRNTPLLLAGLLGLLGAGVLLHTVISSTRRRRRDMAVLKALGFRRRSIGAAVVWQSVTLVALAVVVGVPSGVIAGRFLWRAFARNLTVVSDPVVPLAALVITSIVAIGLSVILGASPGWAVARRRAAPDLAAE